MPKTEHTPRGELVCGKLDTLMEMLNEKGMLAYFSFLISDIRNDCTRMEAKLFSRKTEAEQLRTELAAAQKRIAELEGRTCETCKHNFGPIHYGVGNSMLAKGWIVCNKLEHACKTPFSCSQFEPKKEDKP